MPSDWLKANITPVFEKGSKHLAVNYHPISLTAVLCKILEHILHDIMAHLDANHILINSQHGFRRKFSCESCIPLDKGNSEVRPIGSGRSNENYWKVRDN